MSKRHFEQLAELGRRWQTELDAQQWELVMGDLARLCASENPRFDRARFMAASDRDAQVAWLTERNQS
jgi:hypothetical protein